MTYNDSIFAAIKAIRVNVLRSVLTALGIIIGVAAVIIMIAVGAGAQSQVDNLLNNKALNDALYLEQLLLAGLEGHEVPGLHSPKMTQLRYKMKLTQLKLLRQ